ncbi:hypothetical protein FIBSPDRAFT_966099 [Athelia psychrophila]|uniref:Uncharacterized protein n=1 Tax=Athelia psychrophila TaxID=1759441 RepID=A0A167X5S9_9AGAM|nr:hypothetical protein FIBSPDRAFT_966099 [Fibularhizoctonia sp. CBS 109695]
MAPVTAACTQKNGMFAAMPQLLELNGGVVNGVPVRKLTVVNIVSNPGRRTAKDVDGVRETLLADDVRGELRWKSKAKNVVYSALSAVSFSMVPIRFCAKPLSSPVLLLDYTMASPNPPGTSINLGGTNSVL